MSVIASYARLNAEGLESCRAKSDWLEALYGRTIPDSEVADVDKACDGIVWLLSRLPTPPSASADGGSFVLKRSLAALLRGEGGTSERQLEAPYGPASRLSSEQVAELSAWLQAIDPAQMRLRRVLLRSMIICFHISALCRHSFHAPLKHSSKSWCSLHDRIGCTKRQNHIHPFTLGISKFQKEPT